MLEMMIIRARSVAVSGVSWTVSGSLIHILVVLLFIHFHLNLSKTLIVTYTLGWSVPSVIKRKWLSKCDFVVVRPQPGRI